MFIDSRKKESKLSIHYTLLSGEEIASLQGFLIGVDSEFVSLVKEEIEIHSDGTRSTIRPSRLGLARVSCVRGAIFGFNNRPRSFRWDTIHG